MTTTESTMADRLAALEAQADRIVDTLRAILDEMVERGGPLPDGEALWGVIDELDQRRADQFRAAVE